MRIKDYAALSKPGIIRANVMTAAAGFLFASRGEVGAKTLAATVMGTTLLVACGCVLNNIMDIELDKRMTRTKNRPLVTGRITPLAARRYAWATGITGLITLLIFTNTLTAVIGAAAVLLYVYTYGWAKRKTNYATEIGTLPGAASVLAGYTAAAGQLNTAAWCLFLVMVTWQVAHFLAITLFRSEEYREASVSVLPLRIGKVRTQKRVMVYILLYIISIAGLSVLGNVSLTLMLILVGTGMLWLYKALERYQQIPPAKWGRKMFGYSLIILPLFSLMISVDAWLP